jgi:glycerate-2-kinase
MTVPVGDATGIGGRNQEFVLAAAVKLADDECPGCVVGSVDSDGTDGPGMQLANGSEDAFRCLAGGLVDESTAPAANAAGLDLAAELRGHNSSLPLLRLGSAIITGNTGICAGDLRVVLVPGRAA